MRLIRLKTLFNILQCYRLNNFLANFWPKIVQNPFSQIFLKVSCILKNKPQNLWKHIGTCTSSMNLEKGKVKFWPCLFSIFLCIWFLNIVIFNKTVSATLVLSQKLSCELSQIINNYILLLKFIFVVVLFFSLLVTHIYFLANKHI